jgi:TPR repeat protein
MKPLAATTAFFVALCGLGSLACSANDWDRLKARLGSAEAQFALGQRAEAGADGIPDYEAAAEWYRKASEYPDAQFALSQLIARDRIEPARDGELEALLLAAAERDHILAQVALGELLLESEPQRAAEAFDWLGRAADGGNRDAQFHIGVRFLQGNGVDADPAEAARWLRLAAEQDHAIAQRLLGDAYAEGRGVAADPVESTEWYRAAAEQGDVDAQVELALRYANGSGVAVDTAEAARWFERAAERGDVEA